jgi:YTH domain-containing protein 1
MQYARRLVFAIQADTNASLAIQFSPTQINMPQSIASATLRPTQINARAAELKAQLLKGRERRSDLATPPVRGPIAKQQGAADRPNSLRNSPSIPATEHKQEVNIDDLISQYSDSNQTADTRKKQEKNNSESTSSTLHRPPILLNSLAKSQIPSLGSPAKVAKRGVDGVVANNASNDMNLRGIHISNALASEISEGEILEEPTLPKDMLSIKPKEAQASAEHINIDTQSSSREAAFKPSYGHNLPEDSLSHRPASSNSEVQIPRSGDERQEAPSLCQKEHLNPSDYPNRRECPGSHKQPQRYHKFRDQIDDHRRPDIAGEQNREDSNRPTREARLPTLTQVLPHDRDLREWLEITGYNNAPYRDKILKRRRAIAELDAQRSRLVAEMEADELAGIPVGVVPPSSAIVGRPFPNTVAVRAEPVQKAEPAGSELIYDLVVSNKRSYSDVQETHDDRGSEKLQRTGDRGSQETNITSSRPRSSGHDIPRRLSSDYHNSRDSSRPRYDEARGRGRDSSRERGLSPDSMAYEQRRSARMCSHDWGLNEFHGRGDSWEPKDIERRPFVVRGRYRGRAFDPNYRGRGRGFRGRCTSPQSLRVSS